MSIITAGLGLLLPSRKLQKKSQPSDIDDCQNLICKYKTFMLKKNLALTIKFDTSVNVIFEFIHTYICTHTHTRFICVCIHTHIHTQTSQTIIRTFLGFTSINIYSDLDI
jgi:hypothetical protein